MSFFNLVQLPNQDIALLLKTLVGKDGIIDWGNDFILNLLHHEIIRNEKFCDDLKILLDRLNQSSEGNDSERHQILSKILYYRSNANYIRCGDIVKFEVDSKYTKYGIIITPSCDIAQNKTRYIECIELTFFENSLLEINIGNKKQTESKQEQVKSFNHPSFHFFPAVMSDNKLCDFVAILKSKIVIEYLFENSTTYPYPSVPKRIGYSAKFSFANHEIRIVPICSLNEPYKSDFLQKLHSHNSRIGIPNIKDLI